MLGCRNLRQRSGGCSSVRGTEVYATAQWQQREHKIATEDALGRSTSPRRQRFWLISHRMIDPTTTMVAPSFSTALRHSARDYVTLSAPVCATKISSTAAWPCVSSASLYAATDASASALWPFASPTLASSASMPVLRG